jgi:hypothetical protein
MLGGTFNDTPNFDPVIIGIVPEDSDSLPPQELRFDVPQWYTLVPATISRFWDIDEGKFSQDVVVVPGQFRATSTSASPKTVGTMRLYSQLQLLVYEAPAIEPDYQSPGIWDVGATNPSGRIVTFSTLVRDTAAASFAPATGVLRVVVLYRHVGSNTWSQIDLDYNPVSEVASKSVVVPQNGAYEYFVQAVDNAGNVTVALDHGNAYSITVDGGPEPEERILYVAARTGGTIDGIQFQNNDILAYLPEQDEWVLYFDADDVGFGQNLNAFALLEGGSILLSPKNRTNHVPGMGWIEPQDIIRFTPTATGAETAGSFSWFFDGSDVGLGNEVEAIASIGFTPAGRLVIGTVGNAQVPNAGGGTLYADGADLLMFIANAYGAGTSGYFEHFLDGDAIGIGPEKIWANWIDPISGDVYLTPRVPRTLGGLTIDENDIAVCAPQTSGPITACTFTEYWDGAEHRFGAYGIDSIDLGQPLPFQPPAGGITIVKQTTSGSGAFDFTGDLGAFTLTVPGSASQLFAGVETGAYLVRETAETGWSVQSIVCNDPDGGTTIVGVGQVLIDLDVDEAITCTFTNTPDSQPTADTIYISPSAKGAVGGVAYDSADILKYANNTWSMYFDGSDVGFKKLNAFSLLPGGALLLSPDGSANVAGLGAITAQDIVRFTPTSTGANTAGTFQWYFDGSDVGLSTAAENIDALSIDAGGHLLVSTKSNASVTGPTGNAVRAADEDLLKFTFATSGASTSGAWSVHFDGSDVGLSREDIDGLWVDAANGDHYLSVLDAFTVDSGVSGNGGTIFVCDPGTLGATTTCTYRIYWNATTAGIPKNIDGFFIQR